MKKQKKPVPPAEAEPVIKKQPLLKRLLFGPERPDLSELEAGSTTILDILSPTAIDTKSRDYIVVDGVFHAYLYITGYGYSTTVGSCWLAPLVEAGEGVNVSFSFTRQNREKILSKIAQTTMLNRSRMRDVGDTRQDYEELDSAITSGLYLKDVMNRQGEDFYYMHTLIEVVADDPDNTTAHCTGRTGDARACTGGYTCSRTHTGTYTETGRETGGRTCACARTCPCTGAETRTGRPLGGC